MECADRGAKVFSVEKEKAMIKKLRMVRAARDNVESVTIVSRKEIDFFRKVKDSSVDAVLSLNVIHHLRGPLQHLWDISRVLKSGGVFYFELPKKQGMVMRFKRKETFYLGLDFTKTILANWFSSFSVVLDWRNSVGNERILFEVIR